MHGQFNAQCRALLLAMQHPGVRIGLQAMVYVHRTQRRAGGLCAAPQPVQQHGRVDTAAVTHQQRRIQRNEGRKAVTAASIGLLSRAAPCTRYDPEQQQQQKLVS